MHQKTTTMRKYNVMFLLFSLTFLSCNSQTSDSENTITTTRIVAESNRAIQFDTTVKTIHIFVALCDNKYQGIVPVPVKIGNGQDINNNLYWGCGFGIRTYFKNSKEWKLIKIEKIGFYKIGTTCF
mgnify:CR=1 FL=1